MQYIKGKNNLVADFLSRLKDNKVAGDEVHTGEEILIPFQIAPQIVTRHNPDETLQEILDICREQSTQLPEDIIVPIIPDSLQGQNGTAFGPPEIDNSVTIHSEPENQNILIPIKDDYVNKYKYQLILSNRSYPNPVNKTRIQIKEDDLHLGGYISELISKLPPNKNIAIYSDLSDHHYNTLQLKLKEMTPISKLLQGILLFLTLRLILTDIQVEKLESDNGIILIKRQQTRLIADQYRIFHKINLTDYYNTLMALSQIQVKISDNGYKFITEYFSDLKPQINDLLTKITLLQRIDNIDPEKRT
ncbi:unnamed protein product [Hermetia illucens]|uniref:Uncharacterized protein n=1 Tax=Hermetia illucens TaxID=343691 RepID=A0A7R8YTL0_HERIL|nr:unnamed protein product [Hermetia illucens]